MTTPRLTGQTICILGAAGTVGSELTRSLAQQGAHLVILARQQKRLEVIAESIHSDDRPPALAIPFDLGKINAIPEIIAKLRTRITQLDGLIFAAAEFGSLSPVAHASGKDLARMFAVNVLATQQWLFHAEDLLANAPHPRIAFIDCQLGQAKPNWGLYQASKDAMKSLAKAYTMETKSLGRHVGIFDPGEQPSELWKRAFPGKKLPPASQLDGLGPRFLDWYLKLDGQDS